MCMKAPKPPKPSLLPKPPPTPEAAPKAPVLNESRTSMRELKKKGRTSLRIDLNPAISTGLR